MLNVQLDRIDRHDRRDAGGEAEISRATASLDNLGLRRTKMTARTAIAPPR